MRKGLFSFNRNTITTFKVVVFWVINKRMLVKKGEIRKLPKEGLGSGEVAFKLKQKCWIARPDPRKGVAFVLSGGGNYGALQAGALEILLERGIYPDLLVGTSAGALNAVFLAVDPTLAQARTLSQIWATIKPEEVGFSHPLVVVRRLVQRKPSFYDSRPLAQFIERHLPAGIRKFGDLKVPAYTVAVRFSDGTLRVFGDSPDDLLLDGMISSSAIPPYYPPWPVNGELHVDGGAVSNLPLKVAVERGAREIYTLTVDEGAKPRENLDMIGIVWRTISFMLARQMEQELEEVRASGIPVHLISLSPKGLPFFDFEHGGELVALGKAQAQEALDAL